MEPMFDRFLFFGYLPRFSEADLGWLVPEPGQYTDFPVEDEVAWVRAGLKTFRQVMKEHIEQTPPGAQHVVPLSSGLDSRAILGALLEKLPKESISTITYGIPGAWDYEIAPAVARACDLRHERINLLEEEWDLECLVEAAKRLKYPVNIYEAYVHQKVRDHFGPSYIFWSGFMADSLAGAHLWKEPSVTKDQAIHRFFEYNGDLQYKNQAFQTEILEQIKQEFPWLDPQRSGLCYDQQLDYGLRQKFYIHPVLTEQGFQIITPFTSKLWVDYILSTPYHLLRKEETYGKIVVASSPELFTLPVKNRAGLPLSSSKFMFLLSKAIARVLPRIVRKDPYGSHPRTNYINFCESLRHESGFQKVVYTTLQDLEKRKILDGLDIDSLWDDHLHRKSDHSRLLLSLSTLEILLKSGYIIQM